MKRYFVFVLAFCLVGGWIPLESQADSDNVSFDQEAEQDNTLEDQEAIATSWALKMDQLKKRTKALLDQNERLVKENISLEKELANLEGKPDPTETSFLKSQKQSAEELSSWQRKVVALETDNKILHKELMVLRKKESLRKLQIEDLENQQRQLMLGNKFQVKESMRKQAKAEKQASLPKANVKKESPPEDSFVNKNDISQSQAKLTQLQKQKQSLSQAIESLKNANAQAVASTQEEYEQKKKTKRALEAKIADLEKHKNSIKKKAVVPPQDDRKKAPAKELGAELKELQTHNQQLQKQLGSLNQNMAGLKTEIKVMENRLQDLQKKKSKK